MTTLYTEAQRRLQDRFGTRRLADAQEKAIVHNTLSDEDREFIESRDMVFLSTVDAGGYPTVSYKGGEVGFVRVVGGDLLLPSYDGNGMYVSLGNIDTDMDTRVGMLFIDLERPHRLRVHGTARLIEPDGTMPGAELTVRIKPDRIFVNCPRYIHRYKKLDTSRYVPDGDGKAPLAEWKRIDFLQDDILERDRQRVDDTGTLTFEEYAEAVRIGRG